MYYDFTGLPVIIENTQFCTIILLRSLGIQYDTYHGLVNTLGLNLAATPYISGCSNTYEKKILLFRVLFSMNVQKPELNQGEPIS